MINTNDPITKTSLRKHSKDEIIEMARGLLDTDELAEMSKAVLIDEMLKAYAAQPDESAKDLPTEVADEEDPFPARPDDFKSSGRRIVRDGVDPTDVV